MNKHLAFFKIVCAFGYFAGQPLKALDVAENISDKDLEACLRVLKIASSQMRGSDDQRLRDLSHKIESEVSNLVS